MDSRGGNARELTHNDIEEREPEISPDKSQILFLADTNEKLEPYYNSNLFVMSGGRRGAAAAAAGLSVRDRRSGVGARRRVDSRRRQHGRAQRDRPDRRGHQAVEGADERRSLHPADMERRAGGRPDGLPVRRAVAVRRRVDAGDSRLAGLRLPAPVRVTGAFDTLAQRFALPRQEKVSWKGADGTTIEGLLFYPIDYVAGRRYPLVVQMHGGPAESDKFGAGPGLLLNYFPVLTAHGYAVLRPNYRGSTGYGNAFYRDVVGGFFRNMHLDVLAGVDSLVERGLADPDRLVVMGWSAGGHLTNKLITTTTRFKAASSGAGVADWISMYAQTDTRAEPDGVVRRNAVAEERADRDVLEQLAAQGRRERENADAVFRRRERRARAARPVDRDVSSAQEPRRADTFVRGAARRPPVGRAPPPDLQGEHRAGLVRAPRARAHDLRPGTGAGRRNTPK